MPVKKGRKLQTGESLRSDGRYCYRYTNAKGERRYIYGRTLDELRKKEQQIPQDMRDGVSHDTTVTLNDVYSMYLETRAIKPHVLRHTGCTWLLDSGMQPKAVQYIMGHADFSTTMNIYAHTNVIAIAHEIERLDM